MTGKVFYLVSLILLAMTIVSGCGEQDLYKPPQSDFKIAGSVVLPSQALDVDILGNYAYVANSQGGLQVVDISDPTNPTVAAWSDTPKAANGMKAARLYDELGIGHDIAFLIEGTEGIIAFDVDNPLEPINLNTGIGAYDAKRICIIEPETMGDRYMMFMADSWRAITVLATDPADPTSLAQRYRAEPLGYCKDLVASPDNTHLFVVEDEMGITVYDIRQAYDQIMPIVGNVDTPGYAYGIDLVGDYLFVADKHGGLQSYLIGDDYIPELIATLLLPGDPEKIEIHNGVAFLAADDAGLHVVDIRDPYHPVLLGSVPTEEAIAVAVGENNVVCIADKDFGLIVFQGPDLPSDLTAPATVTNLSVYLNSTTAATLSWTAPGDDGDEGTAAIFDVYLSDAPITEDNLSSATRLARRPFPQVAGTVQSALVEGLTAGTTVYFALTTTDHAGNTSAVSNIGQAVMTIPVLTGGAVSPEESETPEAEFTYSVTYADSEGDAPVSSDVLIDGTAHAMTAVGTEFDYVTGVEYVANVVVGRGSHNYQFAFDDGHGPVVMSELFDGPITPSDPFEFDWVAFDVTAGSVFNMGSDETEPGRDSDETQHTVTLTQSFRMMAIEVTQNLYFELMGRNPSEIIGTLRPVEKVSWFDAVAFCNAYSVLDGLTEVYTIESITTNDDGGITSAVVSWNKESDGYRLPTEAEWEFACRGGSVTSLSSGDLTTEMCEVCPVLDLSGWYCGNSDTGIGSMTQDGASLAANSAGLYDMHGNVWEWCWDTYASYDTAAVTDPAGPAGLVWEQHVRRGGSWYYYARDCRSASRDLYWPGSADNTLGFRIVQNIE